MSSLPCYKNQQVFLIPEFFMLERSLEWSKLPYCPIVMQCPLLLTSFYLEHLPHVVVPFKNLYKEELLKRSRQSSKSQHTRRGAINRKHFFCIEYALRVPALQSSICPITQSYYQSRESFIWESHSSWFQKLTQQYEESQHNELLHSNRYQFFWEMHIAWRKWMCTLW
jgi:hypothetical protein